MAYRMPNRYSNDDEYDDDASDADESVDASVGIDSDFEDDDSVEDVSEEYDDDDDQDDRQRNRHRGGGNGRGTTPPAAKNAAPRGQLPRRSKSFDGDDRFGNARGGGSRSGDRPGGSSHGRRLPPRSKTFDYNTQNSSRSLGGPKMRRDGATATLDKEAIASNRARRLRAMGEGGGAKVNLLRRSQSFTNRGSKGSDLLGENGSDEEGDGKDKKDGGKDDGKSKRGARKPIKRTNSNDLSSLPPEEQQYARTAARGVTRSKSLKAERPNLDKASKNVANRLNAMRSSGEKDSAGRASSRYRTDSKGSDASPKGVALQW